MRSQAPRPHRYQRASAEAKRMMQLGESGRFEFKQTAEAVSVGVLAALANLVASDDDRSVAHVLVGVKEVEDVATGLVRGEPCGLSKGLDRAVARIQDLASRTRPIPVDVVIIEEAVAEKTPFLRLEVRPTMAPHFDDEGRRQTRQGRSTRALSDEELLQIYLKREANSFGARYRQISEALHAAVGDVGHQVDSIAMAIDRRIAQPIEELSETAGYAASAASSAEDAAAAASYNVSNVEDLVQELQRLVESLHDRSAEALATRVASQRREVWWRFTVDTWKRSSGRAERLAQALNDVLSADVSLDDARNTWELRVWEELLDDRDAQHGGKGTLAWWDGAVKRVMEFVESPGYQAPELPDLRSELRADAAKALEDPHSLTRRFADLL